jgi:hypothetical protein
MSVFGVPVDHRLRDTIRKLTKLNEAPRNWNSSSNHSERLRALSQSMRSRGSPISENEVDFACYLAEPAVQSDRVAELLEVGSRA